MNAVSSGGNDSIDDFIGAYSEALRAGRTPPDPISIPGEELQERKAAVELLHLALAAPPSALGKFTSSPNSVGEGVVSSTAPSTRRLL